MRVGEAVVLNTGTQLFSDLSGLNHALGALCISAALLAIALACISKFVRFDEESTIQTISRVKSIVMITAFLSFLGDVAVSFLSGEPVAAFVASMGL